MITLNRQGEDARAVLTDANPGFGLDQIAGAAWLTDDQILALHPNGSIWLARRRDNFDLTKSDGFTPIDITLRGTIPLGGYAAVVAGAHTWIAQLKTDHTRAVGELGAYPLPPDASAGAFIADVARESGDALTVIVEGQTAVLSHVRPGPVMQGERLSPTVWIAAADALARPPRLSPCGRLVAWLDSTRLSEVQTLLEGQSRGRYALPGPALLTPRVVEFFDRWWVLSLSEQAGLTLTPLEDPSKGYQWLLPGLDLTTITDLDAYLSDQVYVVWETRGEDGQRGLTTSEGLAPGLDAVIIIERPAPSPLVPPGGQGVELPGSETVGGALAEQAGPVYAGEPDLSSPVETPPLILRQLENMEAVLYLIGRRLDALEARPATAWPTSDPVLAIHDRTELIRADIAQLRSQVNGLATHPRLVAIQFGRFAFRAVVKPLGEE